MSANGLVAGVDVGGTFTDIVLFDAASGALTVTKVPSTPANQSEGVIRGLESVLDRLDTLGRLVHGTTVSTNTILQRSGADVAMVTSEGFGDVLEIGRTRRMLPSLYDPTFVRPPPLVPRPRRFEIAERRAADGSMLVPLDEEGLAGIAERIRASGAEAVAVCFLHAWADPGNEIRARDVLAQRLPGTWFTTSSEVVSEFREYERFSTTVINAYLLPVIDRYVKALGTRLDRAGYRGPVLTMSSAGGVMDLDTACTLPVRTILSGPAGGVAGATWIAGSVALEDFITCDMGGTSTDVCLIESGRPAKSTESAFMGYPIKGRQIRHQHRRGGWREHRLRRGGQRPEGRPAQRRRGPRPGLLRQGRHRADRHRRERRPRAGGTPAARRRHPARPGARPRRGRGSRHAARDRGCRDDGRGHRTPGGGGDGKRDPRDIDRAQLRSGALHPRPVRRRRPHARDPDRGRARHAAGARAARSRQPVGPRYARQGFELTVDLAGAPSEPDDVRRAFLEAYARQYGHAHASGDIEIVNLRTTVIGVTPKPRVRRLRHGGKMADATLPPRDMVVEGKSIPVSVYERERLPVDVEFEGPAVIEEAGATTVMLPRWRGRRDDLGNLRFEAVG